MNSLRVVRQLLAGSTLFVGVGCSDTPAEPIDARPKIAQRPAAEVELLRADPLAKRLPAIPGRCIVASRTPSGGYRSQAYEMPSLQTSERDANAQTERFAYRGWDEGAPEPTILAVCTISSGASGRRAAEAHFRSAVVSQENLLNMAKSIGVGKTDSWLKGERPYIRPTSLPVHVTDGRSQDFRMNSAIKLGRSSSVRARVVAETDCGGGGGVLRSRLKSSIENEGCCDEDPQQMVWGAAAAHLESEGECEEETISDEPPAGPENDPEYSSENVPDPSTIPVNYCYVQTQTPHHSSHVPGAINVIATSSCILPATLIVYPRLMREKCFLGFFCSWKLVGVGLPAINNDLPLAARGVAYTGCFWNDGWYVGNTTHVIQYVFNIVNWNTQGPVSRLRC